MYTISSIWIDVMRIAQLPEECGQHDENWWAKHQKEIEFALKVLDGLGLVERPDTTIKERNDELYHDDDERDPDEDEDDEDGEDKGKRTLKNDDKKNDVVSLGDHKVILEPTKAMMRLYRAAQDQYLVARDGNVRARLAQLMERKAKSATKQ